MILNEIDKTAHPECHDITQDQLLSQQSNLIPPHGPPRAMTVSACVHAGLLAG